MSAKATWMEVDKTKGVMPIILYQKKFDGRTISDFLLQPNVVISNLCSLMVQMTRVNQKYLRIGYSGIINNIKYQQLSV